MNFFQVQFDLLNAGEYKISLDIFYNPSPKYSFLSHSFSLHSLVLSSHVVVEITLI